MLALQGVPSDDSVRAEFWAQAKNGLGHFVLSGPLVLPDTVELSDWVTHTNRIVFRCPGGWRGQIRANFTLKKTERDWELDVQGCAFNGGTLRAEYLQESYFSDNIFAGDHFFWVEHSTNLVFRNSRMVGNTVALQDAGQVLFDGGVMSSTMLVYRGTTGANGWAGPLTLENLHVEHTQWDIKEAQSAHVLRNYFNNATLWIDARKLIVRYNDALFSTLNNEFFGCREIIK
jgi:hypothetical protein